MCVCMYYICLYVSICVCVFTAYSMFAHVFIDYLHVPFHWLLAAKNRIYLFWYIQSEIIIWTNILAIGHGDGSDLWWRKLKNFHLAKKVNMKCIATL